MSLIPFDDRDGFIWFDGSLVPWREARIHVLTHALHYGSCVFEGERAYNGRIFRSEDHSRRLIASAEILAMEIPWSVEAIELAKYETLEANAITDGYVRPVVWRGSEQMGVAVGQTKIHMAVACWAWPSYYPPEIREKGISLRTSRWRKPPPDCAPSASKAAGLYMINTLARREAELAGYDDALMHDYRGHVVEATGANFFAVFDGVLVTPPPDCFLNGITRQTVMALAKSRNIPLAERVILPAELPGASEIFITGTAAEVTAIGKIDDLTYPVGAVTRTLRADYESLVRAGETA